VNFKFQKSEYEYMIIVYTWKKGECAWKIALYTPKTGSRGNIVVIVIPKPKIRKYNISFILTRGKATGTGRTGKWRLKNPSQESKGYIL